MSVKILDNGKLSAQQVLLGALNDDLENLESVIIYRVFRDGECTWSWSFLEQKDLSWAAAKLQHITMERSFSND